MCPRRHVFIRFVYVELRRNYSGLVGVRWCGTELFTVVALVCARHLAVHPPSIGKAAIELQ
jgi:hypothetical protein